MQELLNKIVFYTGGKMQKTHYISRSTDNTWNNWNCSGNDPAYFNTKK